MMFSFLLPVALLSAPSQPGQVVKLELPAKAMEAPALRHRVLPPLEEITVGNAVVHYATAFAPESWVFTRTTKDFDKQLEKWLDGPLQELAKAGSPILGENFFPLAEVSRGARKSYCDWQMQERLKDGISPLLPDIQGFRTLARFLRVRARWHLANNRPEKALRDIQTLLVFGRHISEGPTLIQYLVGVAVCQTGFQTMHEYMAHQGGANLFWPLAYTPVRFMPFMNAMEGERLFIGAEFPGLERDKPITQEKAQELARKFDKLMGMASSGETPKAPTVMPGLALLGYPEAKSYLSEKLKLAPDLVAKMPVAQVVLIRQLDEYERVRDELFKAAMLPLPQALPTMRQVEEKWRVPANPLGPTTLLRMMLPSMERVVLVQHRADRTIGALRVIEALRHHVAVKGALPEALEETGLPLPTDPYTLKPFNYKRTGPMSFTLEGVAPEGGKPHPSDSIRYEVTIRPPVSGKE